MSVTEDLAHELRTTDRSIRRALNDGLIRAERPSPRKLVVPVRERAYLRAHWPLLADLRQALRTEPSVALAVLYGSVARGDDDAGSDVDLLVDLRRDDPEAAAALRHRLGTALGREVGLARLPGVATRSPLLLAEILREGRVLVDRAGRWDELQSERAQIERRARYAYAREMAATRRALARLEARATAAGQRS